MSLKPCAECREMISDTAAVCPKCGSVFPHGDHTQDFEECRNAAIRAGALSPQGFKEGAAANWLDAQGQSFANSPLAQSRLEAWIKECMKRKGYNV